MPDQPVSERDFFTLWIERLESMLAERDRRYEEKFHAAEVGVAAAFNASKEAITKAEVATDKRFEAGNEIRAAMDSQTRTLLPREEASQRFKSVEEKMDAFKENMAKEIAALREYRVGQMSTHSQGIESRTAIVAIIGAIGTVAGLGFALIALLSR